MEQGTETGLCLQRHLCKRVYNLSSKQWGENSFFFFLKVIQSDIYSRKTTANSI